MDSLWRAIEAPERDKNEQNERVNSWQHDWHSDAFNNARLMMKLDYVDLFDCWKLSRLARTVPILDLKVQTMQTMQTQLWIKNKQCKVTLARTAILYPSCWFTMYLKCAPSEKPDCNPIALSTSCRKHSHHSVPSTCQLRRWSKAWVTGEYQRQSLVGLVSESSSDRYLRRSTDRRKRFGAHPNFCSSILVHNPEDN